MIGILVGGLLAGWIWVAIAKAVVGIDRNHKTRTVLLLALSIVGGCALLASSMGSGDVTLLAVAQSAGVMLAWRSFSRERRPSYCWSMPCAAFPASTLFHHIFCSPTPMSS